MDFLTHISEELKAENQESRVVKLHNLAFTRLWIAKREGISYQRVCRIIRQEKLKKMLERYKNQEADQEQKFVSQAQNWYKKPTNWAERMYESFFTSPDSQEELPKFYAIVQRQLHF